MSMTTHVAVIVGIAVALAVPAAAQSPSLRDALERFLSKPTDMVACPADKQLRLYIVDEGEPVRWLVIPSVLGTVTTDPAYPRIALFRPKVERGGGTVWVKVGAHPWRVLGITVVDGSGQGQIKTGELIPK
jgi:uncharacterized protein YbaR (Trm112 family)